MPDDYDKPYRDPRQMSGPDIGIINAVLLMVCIFALASIAWHWLAP